MKQNFIFTLLALFSMLSLVSCSDWTETEALDSTVKKPWEQDPALVFYESAFGTHLPDLLVQ